MLAVFWFFCRNYNCDIKGETDFLCFITLSSFYAYNERYFNMQPFLQAAKFTRGENFASQAEFVNQIFFVHKSKL